MRRYGWIKDTRDPRDRRFLGVGYRLLAAQIPSAVDLRPLCPPVYDQGQTGSCTGNAIAGAIEFERMKRGLPNWVPSRLFIYYNERAIEETTASDSGAQIRDGIKAVAQWGDCPETEWPFDPSQLTVQPPQSCYDDAVKYKVVQYEAVSQDLDVMRTCLASGYPFVFGFTVHSSFESGQVAQTGVVPMPGFLDPAVGGHAVLAVGYDDSQQRFIVRNSWGPAWGEAGYCRMPYDYLVNQNLASDFWTIDLVQGS